MIRSLPLILLAAPASAHSVGTAHLHSDGHLLLSAGLALIVAALGIAVARHRKGDAQ